MQFPTWTPYGGQDDIQKSWQTSSMASGTNLGNGTWKYHINIADHNNEGGSYVTHIYVFDELSNVKRVVAMHQIVKTDNYVNSLYLANGNDNFNNDKSYTLSSTLINDNFTYEFDAAPTVTTPIYSNGTFAATGPNIHNFIISEPHTGDNVTNAGIGLAIGTNGAVAIAHSGGYYYTLLNYSGDLSAQHRYRFTIKDNVPYLYIDGKLVASGISPLSPIVTLTTNTIVGTGVYGSYKGWANNFVLYNTAR